jgi:hypothetical protein
MTELAQRARPRILRGGGDYKMEQVNPLDSAVGGPE